MKKFLIYVVVLIGVLFTGFTTFYFVQNKENIYLKFGNDAMLNYNETEMFELDEVLVHTEPYKSTEITVSSDNEEVVSYNKDSKTFFASGGGIAHITITTNNTDFARFTFSVHVGDGTTNNPYFIRSASELAKIGTTAEWSLDSNYQLLKSIDLNGTDYEEWTPIGSGSEFSGSFDGSNFEIINLKITSATNAGLFDCIGEDGRVEGIVFKNAVIDGSFSTAGLVAGKSYGKIGLISVSSASIKNTNTNGITGGLVGINEYKDTRAQVYMSEINNLTLDANNIAGGLVGKNKGSIITDTKVVFQQITTNSSSQLGGIVGLVEAFDNGTKYRYSVLQNSLSVIEQDNLTANVGAILGANVDIGTGADRLNEYKNNFYYSTNLKGFAGIDDQTSKVEAKSRTELKKASSYTNWSFTDVWTIEENQNFAKIDFSNSYLGISIYDPGSLITNKSQLTQALISMRDYPQEDTIYEVQLTEDMVYTMEDFFGSEYTSESTWEPIGTQITPFKGKFIVSGTKTLTFKNFLIKEKTASGFFGHIKNAEVNNIIFEDFKITNSSDNDAYSGIIVAYAQNSNILNCNVVGVDIIAPGIIGGAIGISNSGNISNIMVNASTTENYANTISYTSSCNGVIGGVISSSSSKIENITASSIKIVINTNAESVFVGGILGMNQTIGNSSSYPSYANNLTNDGVIISEVVSKILFAGGIAGVNQGTIENSRMLTNLELKDNNVSSSTVEGGIVGHNAGTLKTSYIENASVTGTYLGGIVGKNSGIVTECYSKGSFSGKYVGGLCYENSGDINNCYTVASLTGLKSDGAVSGLAHTIRKDAKIYDCFSSATISGEGETYAETASPFRLAQLQKFFGSKLKIEYGTVENCIIINYGSAKIQKSASTVAGEVVNSIIYFWEFFHDSSKGWIDCTEAECKGTSGFKAFVDNNFDDTKWNLTSMEDSYPTLKNIPVVEEE